MKQLITVDQLNELTDEQKNILREWWFTKPLNETLDWINERGKSSHWVFRVKDIDLPLLSIGQMIEFIFDKTGKLPHIYNHSELDSELNNIEVYIYLRDYETSFVHQPVNSVKNELCDKLWDSILLYFKSKNWG